MRRRRGFVSDLLAVITFLAVLAPIVFLRLNLTPETDPLADRDEALKVAWRGLDSGAGPYASPTPVGNPIRPLLGGLLLFGPFVMTVLTEVLDVVAFASFFLMLMRQAGWRASLAVTTLLLASAAFR